ncbi:MAG: FkbM family methyltransferase [Candidatus Liptonbacteria bacterium]|nr:FkbM family methyltransferase [Candidatus Liptonbacteria bacterium]
MRKLLIKPYVFLRNLFRGRGLSRIKFLKNINLAADKFLRGKTEEFMMKRGGKMYMDPFGYLSERFQEYEPYESDLIESLLKEGDTFVDIGASIGWYTLIGANKVGPSGKVYAFEPDPRSSALLRKNVDANDYKNVTVVEKAVSEKVGEHEIFLREEKWGNNSFFNPMQDPETLVLPFVRGNSPEGYAKETSVKTVSLDDYFKDTRIDLMKIDTEGAENLALKGGKGVFTKNRNITVICEYIPFIMEATGGKGEHERFLRGFEELGFSIQDLDEHEKRLVPVSVEEVLEKYTAGKRNGTNLLFKRA